MTNIAASHQAYSAWTRESRHIVVRDGTRLAADVFRPTRHGEPAAEPLPVLWAHDCYGRARLRDGRTEHILDRFPWLATLLRSGYVVAAVDSRGTGGSFGAWDLPLGQTVMWDAYDVTEWLARQPWSNGCIGMFGRSYLGIAQYFCASTRPPHLRAIFPEMALFDLYAFVYPGGAYRHDYANWARLLDDEAQAPIAAVDDDADGALREAAIVDHRDNADLNRAFGALPFRDSADDEGAPYLSASPSAYVDAINATGLPIYHLAGWNDPWCRDAFLWFNNLTVPQRLVVGPWAHGQSDGIDLGAEHLRWYDGWLKDDGGGATSAPPIKYFTVGAPPGQGWRSAWKWPLPEARATAYYFAISAGASDAGVLTRDATSACGHDEYVVDYDATSGATSRWAHGYGAPFGYPDMAPNDARALTYTSPPLADDLEVTGHPIVHVWLRATTADVDVFAYLESVNADGVSTYVTEGNLRASHRAITVPLFEAMGLPFHSGFSDEVQPLAGDEPVELVFDLHPISRVFPRGTRVRVAITGADNDNVLTPRLDPPPMLTVFRTPDRPSRIVLPIVPHQTTVAEYPFIV